MEKNKENSDLSEQEEKINEIIPSKEPKVAKKKKIIKIPVRTIIVLIIIIALLALAYIFKGLLVVATVNGSPIGRLGVIEKLEKASGKTLLDSMIEQKLIY
jgi:hypothetical protein